MLIAANASLVTDSKSQGDALRMIAKAKRLSTATAAKPAVIMLALPKPEPVVAAVPEPEPKKTRPEPEPEKVRPEPEVMRPEVKKAPAPKPEARRPKPESNAPDEKAGPKPRAFTLRVRDTFEVTLYVVATLKADAKEKAAKDYFGMLDEILPACFELVEGRRRILVDDPEDEADDD